MGIGRTNAVIGAGGSAALKLVTGSIQGQVSGGNPINVNLPVSGLSKIRAIAVAPGSSTNPVTHSWARATDSDNWQEYGSGSYYDAGFAATQYARIISVSGPNVTFQCYYVKGSTYAQTMHYMVLGEE